MRFVSSTLLLQCLKRHKGFDTSYLNFADCAKIVIYIGVYQRSFAQSVIDFYLNVYKMSRRQEVNNVFLSLL
jgi:hypothetical protein